MFVFIQMKQWKLEHLPRGADFNKFRVLVSKVIIPGYYSNDVWWRYYTILHMTGSSTRIIREEHIANLNCIQEGKYYSKATVNDMETNYLTRIAELKTEMSLVLPEDTDFEDAARVVISRMKSKRQNSRSTRPGKIINKTGKKT